MTNQEEGESRLKRWWKKKSTARWEYEVEKIPAATNTDKVDMSSIANGKAESWVRLPKFMRMIERAFLEAWNKEDSQVAEKAEKTVINAAKVCVVEEQYGLVRSMSD